MVHDFGRAYEVASALDDLADAASAVARAQADHSRAVERVLGAAGWNRRADGFYLLGDTHATMVEALGHVRRAVQMLSGPFRGQGSESGVQS